MQTGYVQVYTGNGKGKTTAMLGLALRACGAGMRVYIGQFIKNGEYSEVKAVRECLSNVELEQYGAEIDFCGDVTEEDIKSAEDGLKKAAEAILSGKYDIVMLDEINIAIHCGLINVKEVLELIRQKPDSLELILTGRYAVKEIIEAADLVSEITEIKHYYDKGIMAREGIEQ